MSGVADAFSVIARNPFMLMPPTSGSTGFAFSVVPAFGGAAFVAAAFVTTFGRAALVAAATACVPPPPADCLTGSVFELSHPEKAKMKEEHAKSVKNFIFE
jgi:hypothetical protein